MKYLLIILAAVIIYAAFSYARIFYYSHYSPNPDITQQDKTFDSSSATSAALKYIAAGDSTAVGEGASKVDDTYTYKLAEELSKTNAVQYRNVAVRGAKTQDVLEKQLAQVIEFNPDIITISISANDTTHLISSNKIYSNYQEIIKQLTEKTHAKIFITNVPAFTGAKLLPQPYIALLENRSSKLNPKLLALETDRVKIIDIHNFGWNNYPDRSVTYSLDYFHPSSIGYENWTKAFLSKMIQ